MPIVGMGQAGPALELWLQSMLPKVRSALLAEAAGYLAAKNAKISPVGDPPMDPHPGKMADSWRASAGEPVGADLRDAPSCPAPSGNRLEYIPAMGGARTAHVTNDARSDRDLYPYSYEMGVLGASRKAPEGTVEPSFAELRREWSEVAGAAIAKALSGSEG